MQFSTVAWNNPKKGLMTSVVRWQPVAWNDAISFYCAQITTAGIILKAEAVTISILHDDNNLDYYC